mgnify:CR=1 FL=1
MVVEVSKVCTQEAKLPVGLGTVCVQKAKLRIRLRLLRCTETFAGRIPIKIKRTVNNQPDNPINTVNPVNPIKRTVNNQPFSDLQVNPQMRE